METVILINNESEYQEILQQAVALIEATRNKVARIVVLSSNELHWEIGKLLYEKKLASKHGDAVVKRLSVDLKMKYPDMGMSVRNLYQMKRFYTRFWDVDPKVQQAVALLPWGHINHLITKLGENDEAILYYAEKTIEKGWSRDLLESAVALNMHTHLPEANESNNFALTMPTSQANYANEVFKDTYNFGFLGVTKQIAELELEKRLVEKIKQFLLELGNGFTFIGNQHVLTLNGKDYKVDLLFFHRGLRSLVAIDLKINQFKPEYAGKMNFYLSLLNRQERLKGENPSIGIILCADKDNLEVELALEDIEKPIGVAKFELYVPQKELKQLISEELKTYYKEISATPESD